MGARTHTQATNIGSWSLLNVAVINDGEQRSVSVHIHLVRAMKRLPFLAISIIERGISSICVTVTEFHPKKIELHAVVTSYCMSKWRCGEMCDESCSFCNSNEK